MPTLVIVRHGQSDWNAKNLFTGWRDVPLTEKGEREARDGGRAMREEGLRFDVAHTSLLKRAIKTLWLGLEELDQMWLPVQRDWRLNERHYGALQGLDKAETVRKHGAEQVQVWRRSYATPPPPVDEGDRDNNPRWDDRYRDIPRERLPLTECLKDTVDRVLPYWEEAVAPQLRDGRVVLIAAHGNSLRALAKYLEGISDEDIVSFNIPTGVPRLYQLDDALKPTEVRYLGDAAEIEARIQGVVNQTKA